MMALTEHVFGTWVDHEPKFFRSCLVLGGVAIIFLKSSWNQKITIKKPYVTPNFWCRNFSPIHHFWVWIFFVFKIYCIFGMKNRKCSEMSFSKKWLNIKPRVIHRLVFVSFWHQKRTWFIIPETHANSSDLEYFGWIVQNITYGVSFPLSFCPKITNFVPELKNIKK